MSSRKLKAGDYSQARKEIYVHMDPGEVQEALWEAFERLEGQGIDLGPKAEAILAKRKRIKEKIPKPE